MPITFGSSIWLAAAVLEHTTLSSPQGWFYADALSGLLVTHRFGELPGDRALLRRVSPAAGA